MKLRHGRFWRRLVLYFLIGIAIAVFLTDYWVKSSTRAQLYSDVTAIPHKKIGLLLGCSKFASGGINLYYQYRIAATTALFRAGKIDYVLISGDNSHKDYSEPEMMQADLIAAGIPADRIVLDYAGFRTLDSILRCKYVFDEDDVTIISQQFHNERALFLANRKGVRAIAFNAQDVPKRWSIKVAIREKFARVKMLLDLTFGKGPKFYGPKIPIGNK